VAGLGSFLPPVILEIQANAKEAIAQMEAVNAELNCHGKRLKSLAPK
jgi:hypothetical protein